MVVVVDYDETWPGAFEALRQPVSAALQGLALSIEHVGSTAVPGLAAKPVIDMNVVVAAPDLLQAIERLSALGYEHRGDLGIPLREAFRAPPGSRRHHLYLCPSHSPALANHLAFRDSLRRDIALAREYGQLKRRLAEKFSDDMEGYVEGKTAFVVGVLARAGFAKSAIADIEKRNRRIVRHHRDMAKPRDAGMARARDPTEALKKAAAALPDAAEGTSCNQTSYKAGKKAFLYVGPGAKGVGFKAMFKLDESLEQAKDLAKSEPDRFELGTGNWVTARFSSESPLPQKIWSRWLKEAHGAAAESGGAKTKRARRRKA